MSEQCDTMVNLPGQGYADRWKPTDMILAVYCNIFTSS